MSDQKIVSPPPGLHLDMDGHFTIITIDRPATRNAFTEAMWIALPELLSSIDTRCRGLVLRGNDTAFASGADIGEFEDVFSTPERAEAYSSRISAALDALANLPIPTIALVDGVCVGGGCALALACDIRIASTRASFAITPAKMGLLFPFNDTRRLVDTVGPALAKDMLFTARILDAAEAHAGGLIDRLANPEGLEACLRAYLDRLSAMSPYSVRQSKRMISRVLEGQTIDDEETKRLFAEAFCSADFQEGFRAFLEKRKPIFD